MSSIRLWKMLSSSGARGASLAEAAGNVLHARENVAVMNFVFGKLGISLRAHHVFLMREMFRK